MTGWMTMGESVKRYLAFLRGKASGGTTPVTEVAVKVVGHELVSGKQYLLVYDEAQVSKLQMRMLPQTLWEAFRVNTVAVSVRDVHAIRIIEIEAPGKVVLP